MRNLQRLIYITHLPKLIAIILTIGMLPLSAIPALAEDGSPAFTLEMLQKSIDQNNENARLGREEQAPVGQPLISAEENAEILEVDESEVAIGQPSISTVETTSVSANIEQRAVAARKPAPPLPASQPVIGPMAIGDLPVEAFPTTTERWIRVDLGTQRVVAYDGVMPIKEFIISSGKAETPTVTGTFRIQHKVPQQTMQGGVPGTDSYYNLPGVKWVQYFYGNYGFHTAYWHDNFGTPMSHGCINMVEEDAKWLFDWAGPYWDGVSPWYNSTNGNPGTLVMVHE